MSASSFNRPGAIDLSGLAQRAKANQGAQQSGGPAGPAGAGQRAGGSYVVQLTEQNFESAAIRASLKHPVLVEFYSPRAQNWEQLSDALTELANEHGGRFLLGRLNVDAAPGIVQALQLQAVPTVIALIGGQLAPLFQGVVAKEQIAPVIDQVLKQAAANGIIGRAEPVGGAPADEESEAEEAGPDPRFAAADEALERGDFAAAEAEFDKLLAANPGDAEAKAGKAQTGLLARVATLEPGPTLTAAAAADATVDDHLAAADIELATGDADAAFGRLIEQVKVRSGEERNQVRVRLLDLFETLGNADERVLKARRALMTALF